MLSVLPMAAGSPANRLRHSASEIMATRGPFGRSSSAEKARPAVRRTPSVSRKLASSRKHRMRNGLASVRSQAMFPAWNEVTAANGPGLRRRSK